MLQTRQINIEARLQATRDTASVLQAEGQSWGSRAKCISAAFGERKYPKQ